MRTSSPVPASNRRRRSREPPTRSPSPAIPPPSPFPFPYRQNPRNPQSQPSLWPIQPSGDPFRERQTGGPHEVRPMRPLRCARWFAMLAVLLPAGCFCAHKKADDSPIVPEVPINAAELYTLAFPDAIAVFFLDWPDVAATVRIGSDGCVGVGNVSRVRVEGLTVAEAARAIADRAEVSPHHVHVQVVEFNSRQVILYGQVNGEPRVIDYRGPGTVVALPARAGGLTADAAQDEVHVVRAHLGEGVPAEVLRVDLAAIRDKNDQRTNINVQPLDEVYVGEAARFRIGKALPDFLKPFYEGLVNLIPETTETPPRRPISARTP